MRFFNKYYKNYEKVNVNYINFLENNNSNFYVNENTKKIIKKYNNYYDSEIHNKINSYAENPNFASFKEIFLQRIVFFNELQKKEYSFLESYIDNNIIYHKINKHENFNFNLSNLSQNKLYSKYKNKIIFHLNTEINGYRMLYLPISNKCHIFGRYDTQLKNIMFLFHELGHCFQMIGTKRICKSYINAEVCACINEKLMAKENNLEDFAIKLMNNKILESFAMYNMYCFLAKSDLSSISKIENEWIRICQKYNVKYKERKWMLDYNSLENPQNIIAYTIAYIYALNCKVRSSNDFLKTCNKLINENEWIKKLQKAIKS